MIDENLVNFVRTQVQNGVARNLVVDALLQNNWRITDINDAYSAVEQSLSNKNSTMPLSPMSPKSPEQATENNFAQNSKKGMGVFMKIIVFIIILIFILGIGLFVYLKFFDGNITDIISNIPFVNELIAPKVDEIIK